MCVVSSPSSEPYEILSNLRDGTRSVKPTERWTDAWDRSMVTSNPNVYGLYARSIPMIKWLDRNVRDLIEEYPGEVGNGSMPAGFSHFSVPNTDEPGLGHWILLYVGVSDSNTPRIVQYFGNRRSFTREMGGQSLHLSLSLLFGGTCDPRNSTIPRGNSIENVLRGSMSRILEERMRDMRLAYVQVETPECQDSSHTTCGCMTACENAHLRSRDSNPAPAGGWPTGARPLMNSKW